MGRVHPRGRASVGDRRSTKLTRHTSSSTVEFGIVAAEPLPGVLWKTLSVLFEKSRI